MSQSPAIRVLIVDDHPLAQSGMRNFIEAFHDLALCGIANSGTEALALVERDPPDVILMDLLMPGMDGITATQAIKQRCPHTQIIVLTSAQDSTSVKQALQAGAIGYLLKNVSPLELAQAIRAAHKGRSVLSPEATEALVQTVRQDEAASGDDLSEREREVLQLLVQGLSNTDIADRLAISRSTVKFHLRSMFSKFGIASRAELIALSYQQGLVARHVP